MYNIKKLATSVSKIQFRYFFQLRLPLPHSLTTGPFFADLSVFVESAEVEARMISQWNTAKMVYATVTSDYMHNAADNAQWLQPKPLLNVSLPVAIFSHTEVYFICSASSVKPSVKLFFNSM